MAIAPLIKLINKIPKCENKDISQLLQSAYKADEMAVVKLAWLL